MSDLITVHRAYTLLRKRQGGIGLVEVMVSVLISLFVMAGVLQLFSTSSQNMVAAAGASRIQENMRYAFARIGEDLVQAGSLGCISTSVASNSHLSQYAYPIVNRLGESSGSGEDYDFTDLINGDDNVTGSDNVTTGTDTFRVRYVNRASRIEVDHTTVDGDESFNVVDKDAPAYKQLNSGQIAAIANCSRAYIFMISSVDLDNGTVNADGPSAKVDGQYNVIAGFDDDIVGSFADGGDSPLSPTYLYAGTTGAYQYYIGTSASAGETCSDSAKASCSLFRRENGTNRELVQGVHDMQIEYGWTDSNGLLSYATAAVINSTETADSSADIWGQIDRVNITLSLNSVEKAIVEGNDVTELLEKEVTRTFSLANQL